MATSIFMQKKCYACGEESKYPEVGFMNLGTPDYLDGRPADSHSSVLYMFLQQCLSCGYCTLDVSKGSPKYIEISKTEEYQKQAFNRDYPVTANKYLCWAIIQENFGKYNEAGLAALYASWICDDDKEAKEKSLECRAKAIDFFIKSDEAGQEFAINKTEEQLILIDIHRRNSEFDLAQKICNILLSKELSERDKTKVLFQEDLIDDKDSGRYRIKDSEDNG